MIFLFTLGLLWPSSAAIQPPLALWRFQDSGKTGPFISSGSAGPYVLRQGNASSPVTSEVVQNGPFGPRAVFFAPTSGNNSQRLFAPRDDVPALAGIEGVNATVTLMVWVQLPFGAPASLVAGVWDEYGIVGGTTGARAYAVFLRLGACDNAPEYHGGAAAHISPIGGPTPPSPYCTTAACDPRPLDNTSWHCISTTYDGEVITSAVNGSVVGNGARNPFPLQGGIFKPGPARVGAEFGVGGNRVNASTYGMWRWTNRFAGYLGGVAVWNTSLAPAELTEACRGAF